MITPEKIKEEFESKFHNHIKVASNDLFIFNVTMKEIADFFLSKREAELKEIVGEIEAMKIDLKERHIQLCRDCSKTNRRLNMKFAHGENKGIDKAVEKLSQRISNK